MNGIHSYYCNQGRLPLMFPDRTIARTLFASSNIILFSLVSILGCFWIYRDYRAMTVTTERIRAEQVQAKKELIQTEVMWSINYIAYKRSQVEQRVRSDIQDHVYEAHTIASRIYDLGRDSLSEDQLKRIVVETLRPMRFNNGRGYYFATDLTGVEQLFADRPEMEQKNLLDITDTEERYVIRDMISIAQGKGEGFYEYAWTKPGEREKDFPKIAFVKLFEPFNWFIGTGEYLDDMKRDVQEEALSLISQIKFGNDGYIFVMNSDGVLLRHPDEKLIGENIRNLADPDGILVGQSLMDAGNRQGGDFVQYVWPKPSTGEQARKLSYAVAFPDWGWIIGTGVYLDDVERAIAAQLQEYHRSVVQRIVFILVLLVSFIVVSLVLTRFMSKRLQNDIDRFMSFFRKAATSYEKIDPDGFDFSEFKAIGGYANKLVEDFRTVKDELKSERDKAQSYLDTAGVMFLILDSEGLITLINPKGCELLGYEESELFGLSWFDTCIPASDRERVKEIFSGIVSGQIKPHEYAENAVVSRDGAEKIIAWHNVILRDPNGQITGVLSSGEDIT
ncbi:MAG TPA: PAS domain S-box protein, partial [Deltaproteobacteria bacterium]|nr:PAS domain S-box protein [Deltaproteobacteria bacterium]